MNKNIVVLAALSLGAISASAEEAAAPSLSATSTFGYESKYVFRGVQLADAIITPAVNLTYGSFYAGTWFAIPVENTDLVQANEMDIFAGYTTAISSVFSIDVGATHYAYDEVVNDFLNNGNSLEGYVGITSSLPLSPAVYVYRDFDYSVTTVELKGSYSFTLTEKISLGISAATGYVWYDEASSGEDYWYYNTAANLSYAVSEKSSLSIGARAGGSENDRIYGAADDVDLTENAFWYGMSFTTGF
jgi:uncharacterized protein (TIGR02001 family)